MIVVRAVVLDTGSALYGVRRKKCVKAPRVTAAASHDVAALSGDSSVFVGRAGVASVHQDLPERQHEQT
jgi:hypothetical protein